MKEITCEYCGCTLTEEEVNHFGGVNMCSQCLHDRTLVCDHCGTRIWDSDNVGDNEIVLCTRCYDNYYTCCESCGRVMRNGQALYFDNDDFPYCQECYVKQSDYTIHDYSYKPDPIFYGDDKLYMGVELEMDCGGEYSANAQLLLDIANANDENLYFKHDGSIADGFEAVSHPMSLTYHKNKMPWKQMFSKAISLDYRSHQTSTCGLHIHVNRSAFGADVDEQEEVIGRIIYFVEAHWNELLKFSRRSEANICRWASRYGIADTAKLTYDKAKNSDIGRYVCVNLLNYSTVEFRIFRGTLKYDTFIATLQLVHEICTKAISKTDKQFEDMCWSDFVKDIDKEDKPELINYLKSKQLYVNEPTESESDV